ncbi:sporozoite surface protein 2-like [Lytechinus variegatus]|uniref:sporozoite surface protein 2-like n=1 Tax=Lytechinus variegatus TaxID=7654 RepID=UPI001BB14FC8|nr:sporozoite surface protein 2-like [Lytechinus variegatus]
MAEWKKIYRSLVILFWVINASGYPVREERRHRNGWRGCQPPCGFSSIHRRTQIVCDPRERSCRPTRHFFRMPIRCRTRPVCPITRAQRYEPLPWISDRGSSFSSVSLTEERQRSENAPEERSLYSVDESPFPSISSSVSMLEERVQPRDVIPTTTSAPQEKQFYPDESSFSSFISMEEPARPREVIPTTTSAPQEKQFYPDESSFSSFISMEEPARPREVVPTTTRAPKENPFHPVDDNSFSSVSSLEEPVRPKKVTQTIPSAPKENPFYPDDESSFSSFISLEESARPREVIPTTTSAPKENPFYPDDESSFSSIISLEESARPREVIPTTTSAPKENPFYPEDDSSFISVGSFEESLRPREVTKTTANALEEKSFSSISSSKVPLEQEPQDSFTWSSSISSPGDCGDDSDLRTSVDVSSDSTQDSPMNNRQIGRPDGVNEDTTSHQDIQSDVYQIQSLPKNVENHTGLGSPEGNGNIMRGEDSDKTILVRNSQTNTTRTGGNTIVSAAGFRW